MRERFRSQEKDEALSNMEEVLVNVQEQHGSQLAQLEDRLQTFYQAEWDKVHLTYQQEADKYKALMEQQVRKTETHTHTHTHTLRAHLYHDGLGTPQQPGCPGVSQGLVPNLLQGPNAIPK